MQRQLMQFDGHSADCWCCPGHDKFPDQTYKNNRSKRARSRDIKKEHKIVRTLFKRNLYKEVDLLVNDVYNSI
jgi:hypothetical protein